MEQSLHKEERNQFCCPGLPGPIGICPAELVVGSGRSSWMLPHCLVDVPLLILFLGQLPSHQDLAFTTAIQRSMLSSQSQGQGKGNWSNKEITL